MFPCQDSDLGMHDSAAGHSQGKKIPAQAPKGGDVALVHDDAGKDLRQFFLPLHHIRREFLGWIALNACKAREALFFKEPSVERKGRGHAPNGSTEFLIALPT